ncbi:glutamate--tRNA ligase [Candidatus Peregrinibacteria bacterium]|nr:glutamate--tRNA ligase [Candidatus Peregrinibacteria bacterium]
MEVRTRFAPSPTGYLHIGGFRTCLFNYLLAKKHQGKCILRIEDTDQSRFIKGAAENLIKTLKSLNINFDEGPILNRETDSTEDNSLNHLDQVGEKGPYIQSQRNHLYQKYAKELIEKGAAYYCFATPEELQQMRDQQIEAGLAPIYDRRALKLTPQEIKDNLEAGKPHVIRLKMPREKRIEFKDLVRGKVSFLGHQIDDQILIKSDGQPTYHLANVVDDHLMGITHVIRGDEWLPSTPKHLVMYQALGWDFPKFAHIPLILNSDKSKLSKRQNDVSVESYLEKGYLKEAITNFVALLGWHPGKGIEKEIFSIEELIQNFSLENVNKAGAIFNLEKLNWFNQVWSKINYFKKLDLIALELKSDVHIEINKNEEHFYHFENHEIESEFNQKRAKLLFELVEKYLDQKYLDNLELLHKALLVNEEKIIKSPVEIHELIDYFYHPKKLDLNLLINHKMGVETVEDAKNSLKFIKQILEKSEAESLSNLKSKIIEEIKSAGKKNGQVLWPLRAALTHEQYSVGAFESIWVLGKNESLKRLEEIIN